MRENISVRQWQAMYRLGAFSGKDTATQCEAGWYDWFCRDESLAGRLKQIIWGPRKAVSQALWGEEAQRNERALPKGRGEGYGACADDVMGITDPFILDNFYVWFKNNCPVGGPLYDDVRFVPLSEEQKGKYFLVIKDSPHEKAKWTLYTERYGFQEPEFQCGNVREMLRYVNQLGPELQQGAPDPLRHLSPRLKAAQDKAPRQKEQKR